MTERLYTGPSSVFPVKEMEQDGILNGAGHRSNDDAMMRTLSRSLACVLDEMSVVIEEIETLEPPTQARLLEDTRVGAHFRHIFDHIEPLLKMPTSCVIDYGQRRRGGPEEMSQRLQMQRLQSLRQRLATQTLNDHELRLQADVGFDAQAMVTVVSSLGRELQFVVSHAVHHLAMIRLLLTQAGLSIPEHIGVAPETRRASLTPAIGTINR